MEKSQWIKIGDNEEHLPKDYAWYWVLTDKEVQAKVYYGPDGWDFDGDEGGDIIYYMAVPLLPDGVKFCSNCGRSEYCNDEVKANDCGSEKSLWCEEGSLGEE